MRLSVRFLAQERGWRATSEVGLVVSFVLVYVDSVRFLYGILIAVVVLASLAALSQSQKSTKSEPPGDTVVRESAFRLTLTGKWVQKSSSDPTRWSYEREDGHAHLTVSLLTAAHRLSNQEQSDLLRRIVKTRRDAETAIEGVTAITMTETTFGESHGVLAARYGGVEPAEHRRFATLLLCSPVAITIYYYEGLGLTAAEFETEARATMNSIVVPKEIEGP